MRLLAWAFVLPPPRGNKVHPAPAPATSRHRDPDVHGNAEREDNLEWLDGLSKSDRARFYIELQYSLSLVEGPGAELVNQLLYEWRQTAAAWAYEKQYGGLTEDLPKPLHDVEL